ncbi:hypothetical protein [Bacillus subtilis]|uniref:hypothetical protein n=1 Tax=Bacillus subtilis TaxID=1423 RepID=UPI0022B75633|nr:hypothetical protein [Bacillus subtilis]WBC28249.1 hypothetical protein O6U12_22515 [Bacillus subtilis]
MANAKRLPAVCAAQEERAGSYMARAFLVTREIQDRRSRPRGSMANAKRLPAVCAAQEERAGSYMARVFLVTREIQDRRSRPRGSMANVRHLPAVCAAAGRARRQLHGQGFSCDQGDPGPAQLCYSFLQIKKEVVNDNFFYNSFFLSKILL